MARLGGSGSSWPCISNSSQFYLQPEALWLHPLLDNRIRKPNPVRPAAVPAESASRPFTVRPSAVQMRGCAREAGLGRGQIATQSHVEGSAGLPRVEGAECGGQGDDESGAL
jgi:hypothetical protein